MQTERKSHLTQGPYRPERLMLVVAMVMTVTMFGWQGYHLYWAHQAASHTRTTTLVQAVHSAGEHQIDLVENLEHDLLVLEQRLTPPEVTAWADRYAAASAETHVATAAALSGTGENLTEPVGMVDTTRVALDHHVETVIEQLSAGDSEQASAGLLNPEYLTAQAEFGQAVDGQIAGLAADLEATTAAERLNEYHSVAVALVLFSAAIGAWAVFGRRLRRSRVRLAEEHEQRLEAETELSQLQKMEALGMMADGVAHDVKNLTLIISESAKDVRVALPDGHPASLAVTRIEEATRQADDLAKALLAFGRKDEPRYGVVDLASLVAGMTQLLKYMLPPRIELVVETPPAAWVHGDAVQLQQAIFNLAANSRDAMPESGTLTISIRFASPEERGDPVWLLVIQDTGEGMTPGVKARLFEPFFTTRPADQGTGLGLAIVHRVVSEHRGWIEVSTCPGEGSTFTIGLPALPAPPVVDDPERNGSMVMVANPVPFVRDLINAALVSEGYRTLSASTTAEIEAGFAGDRSAVDLAVIDSQLLHSNGPSVPADIPVIVTGESAAVVDLDRHHDVRVLGEPLSLAALTRCVADLLQPSNHLVQR